jgi:hypothetical protein
MKRPVISKEVKSENDPMETPSKIQYNFHSKDTQQWI